LPSIVVSGTERIIDNLDKAGACSTFFVVGWIAKRYPELLRKIHDRGHEVASHSNLHRLATSLSKEEFRSDTEESVFWINKAIGEKPVGYRAPLASIGRKNIWALDILSDLGFEYDSSIYPTKFLVHSGLDIGNECKKINGKIWEVPLATFDLKLLKVPIAGGFYCRALPISIYCKALHHNEAKGIANNIYFHPWEFDSKHPRLPMAYFKRFIQYYHICTVESKIRKIMSIARQSG
jgi:polysaccharide deacetylase family protein (PEP-CTERM system associated)